MMISKQLTKRRSFFYFLSYFLREKTGEELGLWILIREGHIPSASPTDRGKQSFTAILCVCYWTAVVTCYLLCRLLR